LFHAISRAGSRKAVDRQELAALGPRRLPAAQGKADALVVLLNARSPGAAEISMILYRLYRILEGAAYLISRRFRC